MWALLLLVQLVVVFSDDCTFVGTSSPYIDENSGACYVATCANVGTAPRLTFSTACTGCVSDGGNWLALDQQGIPFSWDNGVTCRRAICNSTTMPNIGVISVAVSLCQNQVYCNPPDTGDSSKHPAGTSWPVATPDGCFQYYCTASGVVQPSAVSTHCCVSSAFTGMSQYFSPGASLPAHSNGTSCITQQCRYKGAAAGSSWLDTVVDQSLCSTSPPTTTKCNETVNGVTTFYENGQIFGDFVQVRKLSGDGFECKRKKCVNGVIFPWPTLLDPGCPPVARLTQTTTATVTVTGPADSTPGAAADDLKDKVTGDPNDPGRVAVVDATKLSSPTAVLRCSYFDGSTKPEGFKYRIQSNDADHHCVDRICKGGNWLGVLPPTGVTCTANPDTTPFSNPQSQRFALQGATQTFLVTLGLCAEDANRLESLFTNPTSVLRTGTFSAQSVDYTNGTLTYTCANGQVQTDSSKCSKDNAAYSLAPSISMIGFLLGFLVLRI